MYWTEMVVNKVLYVTIMTWQTMLKLFLPVLLENLGLNEIVWKGKEINGSLAKLIWVFIIFFVLPSKLRDDR